MRNLVRKHQMAYFLIWPPVVIDSVSFVTAVVVQSDIPTVIRAVPIVDDCQREMAEMHHRLSLFQNLKRLGSSQSQSAWSLP